MRFYAQLRSVLSAVVATMLIAAVVAGGCVDCGNGLGRRAQSGGCCNPDGQCKTSPHKIPPGCVEVHSSDVAVMEQVWQVPTVLPPAGFYTLASTESFRPPEPRTAFHADYRPPEVHILNSALLI